MCRGIIEHGYAKIVCVRLCRFKSVWERGLSGSWTYPISLEARRFEDIKCAFTIMFSNPLTLRKGDVPPW